MRRLLFVLSLCGVALFTMAPTTTKVDQGQPGNQGPWPVTCVSGCSGGAGGSGGTISAIVSIDGGYVYVFGKDGGPVDVNIVNNSPGNSVFVSLVLDGGQTFTVTGTVSLLLDGGQTIVAAPQACTSTVQANTVVGTAAANTPAAQAAGRSYVQLCNTVQNSSSTVIKCRVDGVAPVFAAGNPGQVLSTGDCVTYTVKAATVPQCIANGAGSNVDSYECVP